MGTATITHHVVGQGGKYIAHLEGEDAKGTLERLVADARKQDFLIRPDCSYVAKKFEENDWDAVRA